MKFAAFVAVATVAATRQSVLTLSDDERAVLGAELALWRESFGAVAEAQGLLPTSNSIMGEEDVLNDQLQRLLDTKFATEAAQLANPDAEFHYLNQFSLLSEAEFKAWTLNSFAKGDNLRGAKKIQLDEVAQLEATVDWTSRCNPPVRNQGSCGSCWAQAAVGVSEAAHCIATGTLLSLSVQQVTSCSTNGGSMGCNGGFPNAAIDYASNGLCLDSAWPYTAQTGSCNKQCTKQQLSIGSSVTVSGDSSLASALNKQPVTVVVEAGNNVWKNYKGGVVSSCPGAQSDHAVIAVGYDDGSFKIKNSWGTGWGEGGYMRLQRGKGGRGTCNVAESASYPQLKSGPSPPVPSSSRPPVPSSSRPTPPPGPGCGSQHNVCYWPLTGQVVPYSKSDCALFAGTFVWCP